MHLTERPKGCIYKLAHIYSQKHKQKINKLTKKKNRKREMRNVYKSTCFS